MRKKNITIICVFIVLIIIIISVFITINKIHSKDVLKSGSQSEKTINITNNTVDIRRENETMVVEIQNEVEENKAEDEIDNKYDYSSLQNENSSTDIFGNYYEKALELLKNMSLSEKVGQLFIVRYPDKDVNLQISEEYPGGYVLFGRDFKNETVQSITKKISENQDTSKTNLFIAVDEEGGDVTRVSSYLQFRSQNFKSPQELYKEGGLDRIVEDSHEKSKLLQSLGINYNLAPVADVSTNEKSFIYSRTYGQNAEETATYTKEIIKTMNDDSMLSTLKHFPGYGDNEDTHIGIAIDEREKSEFEEKDFLPFISGIEAGAPSVLVSHNIVKCMDQNLPASLSPSVHKILRDDLGFSGLIITDDLDMSAVKEYVENGQAAVQAIKAGNDIIITSDLKNKKSEIINAIKEGIITEDAINRAVRRVLACKIAYGIIK